MVVGILVVELDHVVVHVLDHQRDLDPVHLQLLELHPRHGAGGVLQQDLVDPVADGLARLELALYQMLGDDFLQDVLRHASSPPDLA